MTDADFLFHETDVNFLVRPMNEIARNFAIMDLGIDKWEGSWFTIEKPTAKPLMKSLRDESFNVKVGE